MALTKPISPDRSKVDIQDKKQVKALSKRLRETLTDPSGAAGISPTDLEQLVETVGNGASAIQKEVGRLKPNIGSDKQRVKKQNNRSLSGGDPMRH